MAFDSNIRGAVSNNGAEVSASFQLKIQPEIDAAGSPKNIGGVRAYSENDQGLSVGTPFLVSNECDIDYRSRISVDTILDEESFAYTAQNFTKHSTFATTYAPSFTLTGFNTNPTNSLVAGASTLIKSNKTFSLVGSETISLDAEISVTYQSGTQLPANNIVEFGFGVGATTAPYDIFDGIYFRINPTACYAVIRNNSATDTATSNNFLATDGVTVWQPVSGRRYQFLVYWMVRNIQIWISDPVLNSVWLASNVNCPAAAGSVVSSPALPIFVRQSQPSAPTLWATVSVGRYSVRRGGQNIASSLADFNSRATDGLYSPGTLTTTFNQSITAGSVTRPATAVPSNITTLLSSLSGIVLETGTLAIGTDGILMSFQNPALPVTVQTTFTPQRRLRIDGVRIGSSVQAAFTAGGFAKYFYIAYGSTTLSLAGVATDSAAAKAYRRVMLELVQAYTATQAAGTLPAQIGVSNIQFKNPIYVNSGEFIALCTYHIGNAGVTGVLQHNVSFDYAWE